MSGKGAAGPKAVEEELRQAPLPVLEIGGSSLRVGGVDPRAEGYRQLASVVSQVIAHVLPVGNPNVPWGSKEEQMVFIPRKRRKAFEGSGVDLRAQIHGPVPGKVQVHALAPGDIGVLIAESVGRDAWAIGNEIQGKAILG